MSNSRATAWPGNVSIWGNGEVALPGELGAVDGVPEGGKVQQVTGIACAFTPDYAPGKCLKSLKSFTKRAAERGTGLQGPLSTFTKGNSDVR
jgi:hypothetical protein